MLERFNNALWGGGILWLLIFTGVYLTVRTRFFQITHFWKMLKEVFSFKKKECGISPFSALTAALSGTLGTGNIAGVGAAIILGGAGSIFWMLASAFLCMIIKFSEVALAVNFKEITKGGYKGGPMYVIKNGLPNYKFLSVVFCIATIVASFGIGNGAQVCASAVSVNDVFGIDVFWIGFVMCLATLPAVFGGAKRLTKITSVLLPVITAIYFFGCVFVLVINRNNIPTVVDNIIKDALDFSSVGGGVIGFGVSRAMRVGVSRGIFTNEAGMGSAPIVHSCAESTPVTQGYWGIFEVFVDTVVMCTITGLVILSSGVDLTEQNGLNLTTKAFESSFGFFGGCFIAFSVFLFAFSACISWCYYGSCCLDFISKNKSCVNVYRVIYCLSMLLFPLMNTDTVFVISDIFNAFMSLPNLLSIILLRKTLLDITNNKKSI